MTKTTKSKVTKMPINVKKAIKVAPAVSLPERLFVRDELRESLRPWLENFLNTRTYRGGFTREYNERALSSRSVDVVLYAIAPLLIELIAPRAGTPVRAAKLLAKRFNATAKAIGEEDDPFWPWFVGEDVNCFGTDFDDLIQWPIERSPEVNLMEPGVPGLLD